jgi:hypothetical protein
VGTEAEHGSTRPDMNWHHSTGGYGGDRDNQGGYPDDRYPTRGPNRPGMYGPGDYGKFIALFKRKTMIKQLFYSYIIR